MKNTLLRSIGEKERQISEKCVLVYTADDKVKVVAEKNFNMSDKNLSGECSSFPCSPFWRACR